jgi:hypothetical protein
MHDMKVETELLGELKGQIYPQLNDYHVRVYICIDVTQQIRKVNTGPHQKERISFSVKFFTK